MHWYTDRARIRRHVAIAVLVLAWAGTAWGLIPIDTSIDVSVADRSSGEPIAGAEVDYWLHGGMGKESRGTVVSVTVAQKSSLTVIVEAPGFAAGGVYLDTGVWPDPLDFALAPSGGIIEIEPHAPYVVECAGHVDVTISNAGGPGDDLAILDILLQHGYSQGDYGRGFTWDLSGIELPVVLGRGESLSFPVSYAAEPGDNDSRLHIGVVSGAREGTSGIILRGRAGPPSGRGPSCGTASPTPTHTPPPATSCVGDCNGDGYVLVNELVFGVALALGDPVAAIECGAMDGNGDQLVTVVDLVAAAANSLLGCSPAP